jgi:MFS family permease
LSRRLLLALLAMGTAQAAVYIARPMTSYRLLGLGSGSRAVGLVTAAFALIPLFVAIPLGRRADRRQARLLIGVGCTVQAVACLLLAWARTPVGLGAASAVLGLGHLGLTLGVQAVIARESDNDHHDRHFGLLGVVVSLGQLVGPLVGGLIVGGRTGGSLADATGRAMLVAAGIVGAAAVFGFLADANGSSRGGGGADAPHAPLLGILSTRGVPAGIFASIAVLAAADVFTAYLPVLGHERGIGAAVVGALLAIRAAASMVSRIGIAGLVRRVGRLRLIAVSAVAAAAALVGMTLTGNVALLVVLSAVVGLGLGFGQPLSMTIVVQLVPEHVRATALAVRLTGNRLGQVAVPAGAGLVAGSTGTGSVFWLLSSMLAASAVAVRRRS